MNKVQLIGRLTKDVESQEYGKKDKGGYYARFAIAVRDGVDKDGNPLTQFINCVAWNTAAINLEKYTKKGDLVAVMGRITENNYEDEEKVKHYSQQVTVSEIELLANKKAEDEEEEKPARSKKYHR